MHTAKIISASSLMKEASSFLIILSTFVSFDFLSITRFVAVQITPNKSESSHQQHFFVEIFVEIFKIFTFLSSKNQSALFFVFLSK
jgi:hypothetical protein